MLWIFEPIDEWAYMGGAIIVIADTFLEAEAFVLAQEGTDTTVARSREDITVTDKERGYHVWLLTHSFKLADRAGKGVIVNNQNWA